MQEQTHLKVFDFDDTLFRVPNYTASEAERIEPYAWFDSPESLSDRFGIRGIKNSHDRVAETGSTSILVTHRVEACREAVMIVLEAAGLEFDEVHFLGRESAKADCVMHFVEGTNIERITIFEDTLWEILSYALKFDEAKISQEVDFVFVDKSKIINIGWHEALALAKSVTVEKLKLT
jgi:hypothetical protein